MKCLHCGYCCIMYDVVIISKDIGARKSITTESNFETKKSGVRCKHLIGRVSGKFKCAIHKYSWYKRTPCFDYGQIELKDTTDCRTGSYVLTNKKMSNFLESK